MSACPTILFVADAVTLAHLVRPATLARGLDPKKFNVILACDPRYETLLGDLPFQTRAIRSVSSERFLQAAAQGRPLYDSQTLFEYVREDLSLIQAIQPAAIVGDHRLSLSISARVSDVPYLGIINAYWSPYALSPALPLPELPINRWLGISLAQRLFRLAWPMASAYHSLPLNRVRRAYGLPSIGWDWRDVYTDADHTLYADAMELVPTRRLPVNHAYLGPILWSPPVDLPSWWNDLPADRPLIYVTLGSSGRQELLETALSAMADLPVTVVAATVARWQAKASPANTHLVTYAPGEKVVSRADLVICNGGSLTVYQALAAGKPFIGIPSNMDQHLSMQFAEHAGVGLSLRSEQLSVSSLRAAVQPMLQDWQMRGHAQELAKSIATYAPAERLTQILDQITKRSER